MIVAKCISKNRNNKGVIISYTLMDANGKTMEVTGQQIKEAMTAGQINIINLQIDKAGRLIDKSSQIDKALIILNLIKELRHVKTSSVSSDLKVITINKEYILSEEEKKQYTNAYEQNEYKCYMEICNNNVREIRYSLGNFQFTQDYDRQLRRIIEWYKGQEEYKNKSSFEIELRAKEYARAELRDEMERMDKRVPQAYEVIERFEQQNNITINYEIVNGVVIIKL